MADLAALIERLEKLTSPDREVDALIFETLVHAPIKEKVGGRHFDDLPKEMQLDISNRVWSNDRNYTASLDTVIALVERELPGWRVDCLQHMRGEDMWNAALRDDKADIDPITKCPPRRWGFGATASIAICIALLRAKGGDNDSKELSLCPFCPALTSTMKPQPSPMSKAFCGRRVRSAITAEQWNASMR